MCHLLGPKPSHSCHWGSPSGGWTHRIRRREVVYSLSTQLIFTGACSFSPDNGSGSFVVGDEGSPGPELPPSDRWQDKWARATAWSQDLLCLPAVSRSHWESSCCGGGNRYPLWERWPCSGEFSPLHHGRLFLQDDPFRGLGAVSPHSWDPPTFLSTQENKLLGMRMGAALL